MKKFLAIVMVFIIAVSVAIMPTTNASYLSKISIESLAVNGYEIPLDKNKNYIGIKMPYDTEKIYVRVIPKDESTIISGDGYLAFTEDKQTFTITLSNGEEKGEFNIVVVRGEQPTQMDKIKNGIVNLYRELQLPLMVIPVVILIIVLMPERKRSG